uniref:Fanconi-associated nuclease n=1 Tax=Lygus hesperus TaxID=30085 RepID=A0A146KNA5_LYGHE
MPTPSKESTPKKTRNKPSVSRTPRTTWKGDELGKNKTQKSITNYFSASPLRPGADSNRQASLSCPEEADKAQFNIKNMPACTPVVSADPITISDDEEVEQSNIENYHMKTKFSSVGTNKKRNISLSRKLHKIKTVNSVSTVSAESIPATSSRNEDINAESPKCSPSGFLPSENGSSNNGCSPLKRFKKQTLNDKLTAVSVESCQTSSKNLKDSTYVTKLNSKFNEALAKSSPECSEDLGVEKSDRHVIHLDERSESSISHDPQRNAPANTAKPRIRAKTDAEMKLAAETAGLAEMDWAPMEEQVAVSSPTKAATSSASTPQKIAATKSPISDEPITSSTSIGPPSFTAPQTPTKAIKTRSDPSTPKRSPFKSLDMGSPQNPTLIETPRTPTKSSHNRAGPSTPKKSPYNSPRKRSPEKSPRKPDREAMSGDMALEHSILECKRYAQTALTVNCANQKVANDYLSLDLPEKKLLHKLLVRKWAWIRDIDMKYDKFIQNKIGSLDALRDKGFLEDMSAGEHLNVILSQLKRPELESLCKKYKIDSSGTKKDELVNCLCKFVNLQGGLGFSSKSLKTVLTNAAFNQVGKCVRIRDDTRGILQKIFEASMSPLYLEGQFYSFQQRLAGLEKLMNEVKFEGKKLIPFHLSDFQLFLSPAQFDEFIASVILKFEILSAKDEKNHVRGLELAQDARTSLMIYLNNPKVKEFLEKTPRYIWKYTAGSSYSSAIDVGIEFLKRAKEYDNAIISIDVLLGQGRFRKHLRGHWYAEKVMMMDRNLKRPADEIYNVLMKGLKEDLTPIGRLELSKKAEGILNKRKNGLTPEQKKQVRDLMRIPRMTHGLKEIRSCEAPNVSTGTRQTFVEFSGSGEKTYWNVEQVARNSYMGEYPEGVHDEGSFVKNIILAAFWPVIYMPKENMFVSRYQNAPLDWGTQAFYRNREQDVQDHISLLREGGIDGVMQQITQVVTEYANHHSLINWFYICFDMLPTIKNILTCLTLDKFLKLADYLLDSFRERRSGWPDLTLWNTVTSKFKLVEVKSPNDELSFKQILWLEKFVELGIDVEECRVNASNKGKKRKALPAPSDGSQEVM